MSAIIKSSSRSLKFKLITLSIGLTFVLGAASIGVLRYLVRTQESAQLNSFESHARSLSDAIGAQFFERYGDVQAFAISPAMQASSRQTTIDMLNSWSAMYGIYDLIMLVDVKGRLVAVNSKGPDGKEIAVQSLYEADYSQAPWFKSVIAGQFTDDKGKGFSGTLVEDVQVDPWTTKVFGSSRLGSSFSAAVKNASGELVGVISNRAGSRWFEVAFKELYSGLKRSGYSQTELALLDRNGTILFEYKSDPSAEKVADPTYDWSVLLKHNLATANLRSALNLVARQSGSMLEANPVSGSVQIVGYTPVTGQKFVDTVGWGVLVKDSRDEAMTALNDAQNVFSLVFLVIVVFACGASYLFANSLSKQLSGLASRLSDGSGEVFSAAKTISRSSTQLSDAATEQASAIQETAASIDEVSSMVKKSADNATQSHKVSQTSRSAAEEGQQAIQEMSRSISEISQSNAAIMAQVIEGNRQFGEIVQVISEIGNKTKVINDIVFQTKLLSFNASVEAARAGEHGKGFAVVAEEVGNLAQMSGNAAKEISEMLEVSIRRVEGIVTDTKSKVEKLVVDSKEKVDAGIQIAERCGQVLTNILSTVEEVEGMVSEISSASQEQAQGVSEINKAMNQLDQVTQQNTAISQSAATSAEQLSAQAEGLRRLVSDLFMVINGTGEMPASHDSAPKKSRSPSRNTSYSNVVPIGQKKQSSLKPTPAAPTLKMAVGAERTSVSSILPSKDDPRFEDV